ncbi:hypothetical protein [Spirosoma luteolum]
MKSTTRTEKEALDQELQSRFAVMGWVAAAEQYCSSYFRLMACIEAAGLSIDAPYKIGTFVGQCPVDELISLSMCMQEGLENLVQEMDDPGQASPAGKPNFQKLIDHTRILKSLVEQADIRLKLAALPAC